MPTELADILSLARSRLVDNAPVAFPPGANAQYFGLTDHQAWTEAMNGNLVVDKFDRAVNLDPRIIDLMIIAQTVFPITNLLQVVKDQTYETMFSLWAGQYDDARRANSASGIGLTVKATDIANLNASMNAHLTAVIDKALIPMQARRPHISDFLRRLGQAWVGEQGIKASYDNAIAIANNAASVARRPEDKLAWQSVRDGLHGVRDYLQATLIQTGHLVQERVGGLAFDQARMGHRAPARLPAKYAQAGGRGIRHDWMY